MKCARMISRFIGTSVILSLLAPLAWTQNYEEVIHYHSDALGSPVAATDANGDLLWSEEYAPYGSRLLHESRETDCSQGSSCLPVESIWDEKQWYTSKYEETRVGIQYYGARWYEPEIGRFLSIDPAEFEIDNVFSFNRYAYANNNPYRYIDPDGRIAETPWDVFNIGLGVTSFVFNLSTGNIPGAVVDAVGVVADTVATIVPGLPGGAGAAIKAARSADVVLITAKGLHRPYIRKSVRETVESRAKKTADGRFRDANTGKPIDGNYDLGHKRGHEFRREKAKAEAEGLSQKEFNDRMNNPDLYQIEHPSSNRSHKFEER